MTIEVKKVWGSERWLVNSNDYCGKVMILNQGFRCSTHKHLIKDETFYIVGGMILMESGVDLCALERRVLRPGDHVRINPGVWHRFTGIETSEFIEISTHHEDSDSVRHTKSEKVPDDEWPVV